MTCIIGMVHGGKAWIGGDSAGVAGYNITTRADTKVFRNGPYVIGFTSSFRMGQLLQYNLTVPEQAEGVDDMRHMVTVFIPAVRQCLKDGGFLKKNSDVESGGSFLVAYRGQLYEVGSDFQVGQTVDNMAAVGCGEEVALGAMHALTHLDRAAGAPGAPDRREAERRGPRPLPHRVVKVNMAKTWTMTELDDAWAAMNAIAATMQADAAQALAWVRGQVGSNVNGYVSDNPHSRGYGPPHHRQTVLVLYYETYGPHRPEITAALGGKSWARASTHQPGFSVGEPFYEVDTPTGTFQLTLQYFDNHSTGY